MYDSHSLRYIKTQKIKGLLIVDSPWQNPLPIEEYTTRQVVVYFHSEFWIPITCFCLSEAIALYNKAVLRGQNLMVFPPGLNLETNNILLAQSPELQAELIFD